MSFKGASLFTDSGVESIEISKDSNANLMFACLAVITLLGVMVSLGLGHYKLSVATVLDVLWSWMTNTASDQTEVITDVVLAIRLPRVIAALLVGAALAAAGTAYQTIFRNTLASPTILGVSAGAGFGAALAMLLQASALVIQMGAFVGGVTAVASVLLISRYLGKKSTLVLVLSGLVVSALFQALTSLLKYVADPLDTLPSIVFWMLGSLSRVTTDELLLAMPIILIGIVFMYVLRWPTQVLEVGDEEARTLGVRVNLIRVLVILAATFVTAAAVSIAGIVGWVGLLIPHLARLLVGPVYSKLFPMATLMGAAYLLFVDNICRSGFNAELPLGIVTAIIGAPLFVFVLLKVKNQWS